jgi:ATP-dependent protease Clp ATPase subunit
LTEPGRQPRLRGCSAKKRDQAEVLIAPQGHGVYICDKCVDLCNEIIAEYRARADRDADSR